MKRREAIVGIALLAAMPLPIEQSSKFELIVNVGAAKAQGLAIPQSALFRADPLIP